MNKRDSNYELMRIISMFLIVLYHIIYHGSCKLSSQVPMVVLVLGVIEVISLLHVNSFILVTGYYNVNSKFKLMKVVELLALSFFYSFIFIFVFGSLGLCDYTPLDIVNNLNPLCGCGYWFVRCYVLLYIFSPFINRLIKNISQKEYKTLLILMLLFFSLFPLITNGLSFNTTGYTFVHFIMMYMLGAYLKIYPIKWKEKKINKTRIILILLIIICSILHYFIFNITSLLDFKNSFHIESNNIFYFAYNGFFVLVSSISYFLFFQTIHINSNIVNKLSKLTFGVYLLHDNNVLRPLIYKWFKLDTYLIYSRKYILYVFIVAIIIYITCLLIEGIRQFIFNYIKKTKFYVKMKERINSLLIIEG